MLSSKNLFISFNLIFIVMNDNHPEIDHDLMLECIKIASNKCNFFNLDYITADAKDIYNFIKEDKLKVVIILRDNEGNYLHTESHQMTYSELIKDYIRLKAKECTQEAIQAKRTTNDGKPLDSNIKKPKHFFSFLSKYF
ncbi:hypothetical protein D0T84_01105 [Dysgonomonas sp. 521]|nr:hypothetical protein [Dysgonomonas sp. 521]